jgi:hypothetical protein
MRPRIASRNANFIACFFDTSVEALDQTVLIEWIHSSALSERTLTFWDIPLMNESPSFEYRRVPRALCHADLAKRIPYMAGICLKAGPSLSPLFSRMHWSSNWAFHGLESQESDWIRSRKMLHAE